MLVPLLLLPEIDPVCTLKILRGVLRVEWMDRQRVHTSVGAVDMPFGLKTFDCCCLCLLGCFTFLVHPRLPGLATFWVRLLSFFGVLMSGPGGITKTKLFLPERDPGKVFGRIS